MIAAANKYAVTCLGASKSHCRRCFATARIAILMKKRLFAVPVFALVIANASACSFPLMSVDQQVEHADEIFIATLVEAKVMPINDVRKWPWIEGRFQVRQVLKGGAQPNEIVLTTGMGRSDCGAGMMVSSKYVIFKDKKDTGIGAPTGTHIIEDFQENELAAKIQSLVRQQERKAKKR